MLASQRRKLNQLQAKATFMHDNAADFPITSPGGKTAKALDTAIQQILSLAGEQSSNEESQHLGIKADNLDKLIRLLRKMNRAANSMADEIDGVEDLFRLPRRRSEQNWLAVGRTFYSDSEAYEETFFDYDLPAAFHADLLALINAVEAAGAGVDSAAAQTGGATGGLVAAFREAGKYSNKLNGIVENKYDDNAQKLSEWKTAAHLEAAPERKKEEDIQENKP